MSEFTLTDLEAIIAERASASPEVSHTARLLDGGPARCAQKLGEEAVEAALASVAGDRPALTSEAADLLYHLLVVLKCADIPLSDVVDELAGRTGRSGLAEKAARTKDLPRDLPR